MRRREFITLLGGAAAAWPLAARAQQPSMPVVGFLAVGSPDALRDRVVALPQRPQRSRLRRGPERDDRVPLGWRATTIGLPALLADVIRRRVAVIAAPAGSPVSVAAKAATATIPIVFGVAEDPVKARARRQPRPAGRQRHGHQFFHCRDRCEAARTVA